MNSVGMDSSDPVPAELTFHTRAGTDVADGARAAHARLPPERLDVRAGGALADKDEGHF